MTASITLATGTPAIFIDAPPGSSIVGTDPYGDGSDATYAACTAGSSIQGSLANLVDTRTATDVVLRSRIVATTTSGGHPNFFDLALMDFTAGELITGFLSPTPPADGVAHDLEVRVSVLDPGNLAYYIGWLKTGTDLGIRLTYGGSSTGVLTVYAATVTVEFASTAPAPLRIYPRSQTRLYPRRNTRRPGTF